MNTVFATIRARFWRRWAVESKGGQVEYGGIERRAGNGLEAVFKSWMTRGITDLLAQPCRQIKLSEFWVIAKASFASDSATMSTTCIRLQLPQRYRGIFPTITGASLKRTGNSGEKRLMM